MVKISGSSSKTRILISSLLPLGVEVSSHEKPFPPNTQMEKYLQLRNLLEWDAGVFSNSHGSCNLVAPGKDRTTSDDHKESRRAPPSPDSRFIGRHSHLHDVSPAYLSRFPFFSGGFHR